MSVRSNIHNLLGRGQKPQTGKKGSLRKPQLSTVIMVAFLVLGLAIMAYPSFADWWNSYHQYRAISEYVDAVKQIDSDDIDTMLSEARAYNEHLHDVQSRYIMSDEERTRYESVLNVNGTGVMGYIEIASLGISYPIYHGINEQVLQHAIGHIEGTSLPVGGANTHTAVSGHRGLPSAKLFSDLDEMVEGDTFTITVLNKTLLYQVDQIRIVEPNDMRELSFVDGEDLATLVTCTPYGVNTHRLLVRGHRIEGLPTSIPAEALQIPSYIAIPVVGIPLLFIYLIGSLIYYRYVARSYTKEEAIKDLLEMKENTNSNAGNE